MSDKLTRALERRRELETILASAGSRSDPDSYAELMKEYRSLSRIADKSEEYFKAESEIKDLENLLLSENDSELKGLCENELSAAQARLSRLSSELRDLLLPRDPDDDRNVILEIRAGAGGEEAALFAADLFRMYSMYAERNGFSVELLSENRTELGGFRQLSALLSGAGAFALFRYESGVHRVQRVPVTESQGRIQTSTVTVAILPEAKEIEVNLAPGDIRMESCKSSGAGGQHINKTESAVRLTHVPTGIVVECQEERSQFKNREKAMKLLLSKLYEIKRRERDDTLAANRKKQVGSGDRSEKIRTYNFPQGRVTDHRIGFTVYTLDAFLNGEIGEMIDALRLHGAEENGIG